MLACGLVKCWSVADRRGISWYKSLMTINRRPLLLKSYGLQALGLQVLEG